MLHLTRFLVGAIALSLIFLLLLGGTALPLIVSFTVATFGLALVALGALAYAIGIAIVDLARAATAGRPTPGV
jgi:hypothetical protein